MVGDYTAWVFFSAIQYMIIIIPANGIQIKICIIDPPLYLSGP